MAQSRPSTEDLAAPAPREAHDDRIDLDAPGDDGRRDPMADTAAMDALPPADLEPQPSQDAPLLEDRAAEDYLARWSDVQARFVDDPQAAVRDGDSLVAEVMQEIAQRFSQHKAGLEEQWSRGGEPETEQLRLALQSYRSFFERLLAT